MKLLHCSDLHGCAALTSGILAQQAAESACDVIVCSGDLLPNEKRGQAEIEEGFQASWLNANMGSLLAFIAGRPFLFVSGNHDYIDPCPLLCEAGVNAINLDNRLVEVGGLRFYGFPWIPHIAGEWRFELMPSELAEKTAEIPFAETDVLICHCPPFGFLDMDENDLRRGNSALTNQLYYGVDCWPKAILCGHIHHSFGVMEGRDGCVISNAATATGMREIEVTKCENV